MLVNWKKKISPRTLTKKKPIFPTLWTTVTLRIAFGSRINFFFNPRYIQSRISIGRLRRSSIIRSVRKRTTEIQRCIIDRWNKQRAFARQRSRCITFYFFFYMPWRWLVNPISEEDCRWTFHIFLGYKKPAFAAGSYEWCGCWELRQEIFGCFFSVL